MSMDVIYIFYFYFNYYIVKWPDILSQMQLLFLLWHHESTFGTRCVSYILDTVIRLNELRVEHAPLMWHRCCVPQRQSNQSEASLWRPCGDSHITDRDEEPWEWGCRLSRPANKEAHLTPWQKGYRLILCLDAFQKVPYACQSCRATASGKKIDTLTHSEVINQLSVTSVWYLGRIRTFNYKEVWLTWETFWCWWGAITVHTLQSWHSLVYCEHTGHFIHQ